MKSSYQNQRLLSFLGQFSVRFLWVLKNITAAQRKICLPCISAVLRGERGSEKGFATPQIMFVCKMF